MSQFIASRGPAVAAALFLSAFAAAQSPLGAPPVVRLSEIFVNPPGSDNGQEFIELAGTPGASLNDYALLVVEGDGTGAGVVDYALDFAGQSLGTNGLYLRRDGAAAIIVGSAPALFVGPNAATTVQVVDFAPDLENGSYTFLLVAKNGGTPPAVGTDLDTDNDGALNVGALGVLTVVDAVALIENDGAANVGYADDFGFAHVGPFAGFNPDLLYRERVCDGSFGGWRAGDVVGTNPGGPYVFDDVRTSGFPFGPGLSWSADPGRPNHCVFNLSMTAPGGFGTLALAHAGGEAGALYLTALSFDAVNATSPYVLTGAGYGLHAGLNVSLGDLSAQFFSFAPPFVGVLDGAGASSFLYEGGMPPELAGQTLYAASYFYSFANGDFGGRTSLVSLTL
jgi:hypothetical protein